MELTHRPELKQKVTLSPQVYQGLNILAMPIAQLELMVEAELLENPMLEVDEPEPDEYEEQLDERSDSAEDERAWDEWLDLYDELDSVDINAPRDPNQEVANTEEFVGGIVSFDDYLNEQVGYLDVSDDILRAARAIIGSLDGDGFFVGDCREIAALADVTVEAAEQALRVVQQLDPPGVGARTLVEALKIQMEYLGLEEPLLEVIIREHLDEVASNHYRKIARALRVDEDEVRRLVTGRRSTDARRGPQDPDGVPRARRAAARGDHPRASG